MIIFTFLFWNLRQTNQSRVPLSVSFSRCFARSLVVLLPLPLTHSHTHSLTHSLSHPLEQSLRFYFFFLYTHISVQCI
ncbi:hypothetical protein BC939DRAFT_467354 [Gamsiella multidivaricata]|uniref:uncharacterized protein n=1 Tax=Gamsiella multidivaricata TaxID=101098 RepID=UPI00221FD58A|nr:uncharacterized protein BC939DRAFT_467354 [Gamsiella multidivaricata]KAI7816968.1 hypothetical protein BC939DRAFT_467354 [Gamsiella multidivaricata]